MLFPVNVVATTYGVCNLFSRVATMFAPYVAELEPIISEWTFIIIAVCALLASGMLKKPEDD